MSLSKKNNLVVVILVCTAILGYAGYWYAVQPPAKIETKNADFTGSSDRLLTEFLENSKKWQDKIAVVSGKITSVESKGVILSSGVYCQFQDQFIAKRLLLGEFLILKGRIIGYDDLLEELKLDQCIIQ